MKPHLFSIKYIPLVALVLFIALSACSPASVATQEPVAVVEESEEPQPTEALTPEALVFTDDLGSTIELVDYPQRIVSISPSMTEVLFAIGAGDQLVGRDDFSVYPEAAAEITSIGSLWEGLPTESILALEPDLIVAAQIISEEHVQTLRDLGLTVFWQSNPQDFDGLYTNLRELAKMTGHEDETETLIADLTARVDAVQEALSGASESPSVFYEVDATDPSNPYSAGAGTFIDYIINQSGGTNIAASVEGEYPQISVEALIDLNPEVILLSDAVYGITPESVAGRPGWEAITAVQKDAIYPIDPNIMSLPGPRLVDALEEVARLLHPAQFE